jgi:hypothetical protein
MSRPIPSDWQRIGESRVGPLYSKALLEKIFLHLRSEIILGESQHSILDEKEKVYAKRELLRIAHELKYDLHQRGRPTSGAQRAAIQGVLERAVMMRAALNELDPLSREAIHSEVRSEGEASRKKDKRWQSANPPQRGTKNPPLGMTQPLGMTLKVVFLVEI